ncbi:serine/threonine protein kinase [Bacteroides caecicola]|uniref:Serine/threonine protein kinase n=1 Tax=Bacteroides caecicola TaxID=1462569 RepID=A0ABS2FAN8_9BACE|nr:serine/threonine-protein kinase [Bacteroides caecicola]MBM6807342.1 serine/threonine protein kinase [Bacteroides caecicola]
MERNEFNIINKIAEGGQKIVYFAESKTDPSLKVVVKDAKISSMVSLQRIMREINFLSGLNSCYFPKNYGSNFDMTTMTITVIEEYIEGSTLRNVMSNYQSWDEIKKFLNELINALEVVWDNNVVHRDLKPENIIIRPDGTPCIIDFGIARFLDMESITNTLQQMGPCTPLYASPEQLRNDKNSIDIRTDFYAIGIIILELYLQKYPFAPDIVGGGLLYDNLIQGRYALSTADKPKDSRIASVVERLLQVQPYMRPRTISQFRNLINTI